MGKNTKRLLIVTPDFPPKAGGVSLAAAELARGFSELQYEVKILTLDSAKPVIHNSEFEDSLIRLPPDIKKNDPSLMPIMQNIRATFNPECIIINGTDKHFIYAIAHHLALMEEIPIIYRSHGSVTALPVFFRWNKPPAFGIKSWLLSIFQTRKWIKKCASFSQIVFLSSQQGLFKNYDRHLACKWKLDNISDIPNTFTSIKQNSSSFREKYNLSGTVFTYIAGFSPRKNQIGAVRSIRNSDVQNISFVFIGPERNEYAVRAEKVAQNDSRFVFLYNIPRQDVIEAQNASDCGFLFATHEQQPLVLLEAMSCSRPWISTNVGSVSEMKGGIVLTKRKAKHLIDAIKIMQDSEIRDQFGREGYAQWQTLFSPESVYKRWGKLLADIIGKKPIRGGY